MTFVDVQDLSFVGYIEQTFIHYRNSGLQVSPIEHQLIQEWKTSGIPMEMVCSILSECHQNCQATGVAFPKSLNYFAPMIWKSFALMKDKMVGGNQ